jgi:hypothetical protein
MKNNEISKEQGYQPLEGACYKNRLKEQKIKQNRIE